MHFLVEDFAPVEYGCIPESARTNPLSYDEVTHQDDLAIPVLLPERMANNDVPAAYFWTVPFEKQATSPILTPPKIA